MRWRGLTAPNIDSDCTGTTMGDYLRVSDLEHVPAEVVDAFDTPKVDDDVA